MNCYFLSDLECYLKIDGEYKGVVSKNLSFLETSSTPLFEFLPFDNNYFSVHSTTSNKNLKIYDIYGEKLIYPIFNLKNCHPFKVISQTSKNHLSYSIKVTLVTDGAVKFYIDGSIYDIKSLPFVPTSVEIEFYKNYLLLSFIGKKTALFIYNLDTNLVCFSDLVDSFYISNVLVTRKEFKTITKTTIIEEWNIDKDITFLSRRDEKLRGYFDINSSLTPLSFIENAVIGGSVKEICTPKFSEKIANLKEFLGKVIKAIPSPNNPQEVWLLYENFISILKIEYENRLIDNILIDDLDN